MKHKGNFTSHGTISGRIESKTPNSAIVLNAKDRRGTQLMEHDTVYLYRNTGSGGTLIGLGYLKVIGSEVVFVDDKESYIYLGEVRQESYSNFEISLHSRSF